MKIEFIGWADPLLKSKGEYKDLKQAMLHGVDLSREWECPVDVVGRKKGKRWLLGIVWPDEWALYD